MSAGRELDALIAEHIMGLNVVSKNHPCGYDPECGEYGASSFIPIIGGWYNEEGPVYLPKNGIYPPIPEPEPAISELYCYVIPVPFYSDRICDAWRVAEKFVYYEIKRLGYRYSVYIESNNNIHTGIIQENNLPLAICKAALLTTLEEEV